MADIAYLSSGVFSTATPYKVVAKSIAVGTTSEQTTVTSSAPVYIPFTPSEAGDCKGAFVGLTNMAQEDGIHTARIVTVTLQQYSGGSWSDTSSTCSKTIAELAAGTTYGYCSGSSLIWYFFDFSVMTALTAVASTWRLKVSINSTTTGIIYVGYTTGTVYAHAIVKDATTTYSSSDNIWLKQGITMTVDQSITITYGVMGIHSIIEWDSTPASAFTFTGTGLWLSRGSVINIGTVTEAIPYAQLATWTCPLLMKVNYYGAQSHALRVYGEKPTLYKAKLSSSAASGQAKLVLATDCSSKWANGDSVRIYGATSTASNYEDKVVSSVSGTEVTLTTNLSYTHGDGYYVVNFTQARKCGVYITSTCNLEVVYSLKLSGVRLGANLTTTNYTGNAAGLIESMLLDTVHCDTTSTANSIAYGIVTRTVVDAVLTDITTEQTSFLNTPFAITMLTGSTFAMTRYVGYGVFNGTIRSATFNDCQFNNSYSVSSSYNAMTANLLSITFNDCRFRGGYRGLRCDSAVDITLNDCYFDATNQTGFFANGVCVGIQLNDCIFGNYIANPNDFDSVAALVQIKLNNCKGITVYEDKLGSAIGNSYIKSHKNNQTTNNHTSWYIQGKLQSVGDGLSDTTVHTAGTGKFAIRLEPMSSTSNLEWASTVPTGDISTKTMTVSVWCKINNANYYAGTHQLPRLTIDYDNGTTAYAQAAETTDWQLLFVTFTPTTNYGQITATLSGRTDATTTNAYVYFDDIGLAYPPSVTLDLGGLDNWAEALPVTPPIAIPISAQTVAQNVWQQLKTTSWGTNSLGEWVKKLLDKITFWGS